MPHRRSSNAVLMAKILLNTSKILLLTLFMMVLTYSTITLGYLGAGVFFGAITLLLGFILYKKASNEWVRAQFGEYKVGM